ncbi:hypothetical protein [Nocardia testacea]|uniref:hypothetical protein n=1 Tax=Nocardia testacea TaxID=248551 RepID=UPI0012F6D928|nr:hypothetical protein [Nocardia testacea]
MDHTLIPNGGERGTVKAVRLPEPGRGEGDPVRDKSLPALNSPVVVELHGHPHRYVVRAVPTDDGPVLAELRVLGDGPTLDHDALASVSPRRLAYAAMQWLSSGGGLWGTPGDTPDVYAQPENADAFRHYNKLSEELLEEVAAHVITAKQHGKPVRKYVADKMHKSIPTVARYIRDAKAAGYLSDAPLPKVREQPEYDPATQLRPDQSS